MSKREWALRDLDSVVADAIFTADDEDCDYELARMVLDARAEIAELKAMLAATNTATLCVDAAIEALDGLKFGVYETDAGEAVISEVYLDTRIAALQAYLRKL